MVPRKVIIAFALAAALAAGSFVAWQSRSPQEPETAMVLPEPTALPAFSLLDQRGEAVDATIFKGQWDLVFFGFTHCPDICPTTLQILATARRALEERGVKPLPRIVLVSVDPERDTPEIMGRYVEYFGDGNLGITGDLEEVRKLTSGLGIYFQKQATDGESYNVDHSAAVLVVDPDGRFSALFTGPHVADDYVRDLPILMADS
jgi:protein SCO1/2